VRRDLFKDGPAREIDGGPDREAALAAPGELIERGLSVDIGKVEKTRTPKAKAPARKPAPDAKARARADALEAEREALAAAQAKEPAALVAERATLERRAEALAKRQAKARAGVKAKLKAARVRLS